MSDFRPMRPFAFFLLEMLLLPFFLFFPSWKNGLSVRSSGPRMRGTWRRIGRSSPVRVVRRRVTWSRFGMGSWRGRCVRVGFSRLVGIRDRHPRWWRRRFRNLFFWFNFRRFRHRNIGRAFRRALGRCFCDCHPLLAPLPCPVADPFHRRSRCRNRCYRRWSWSYRCDGCRRWRWSRKDWLRGRDRRRHRNGFWRDCWRSCRRQNRRRRSSGYRQTLRARRRLRNNRSIYFFGGTKSRGRRRPKIRHSRRDTGVDRIEDGLELIRGNRGRLWQRARRQWRNSRFSLPRRRIRKQTKDRTGQQGCPNKTVRNKREAKVHSTTLYDEELVVVGVGGAGGTKTESNMEDSTGVPP